MSGKPLLTIEQHVSGKLNDALKSLQRKALYVGIAKDSELDSRGSDEPSNSHLGFIHEFGSPMENIPARPFLVPGVKDDMNRIKRGMGNAMRFALNGDEERCDAALEATAINAASAVKNYMATADFAPLSPVTIQRRRESRQTQSMRKEEKDMDSSLIKPLIDTGTLQRAIDGFFVEE